MASARRRARARRGVRGVGGAQPQRGRGLSRLPRGRGAGAARRRHLCRSASGGEHVAAVVRGGLRTAGAAGAREHLSGARGLAGAERRSRLRDTAHDRGAGVSPATHARRRSGRTLDRRRRGAGTAGAELAVLARQPRPLADQHADPRLLSRRLPAAGARSRSARGCGDRLRGGGEGSARVLPSLFSLQALVARSGCGACDRGAVHGGARAGLRNGALVGIPPALARALDGIVAGAQRQPVRVRHGRSPLQSRRRHVESGVEAAHRLRRSAGGGHGHRGCWG